MQLKGKTRKWPPSTALGASAAVTALLSLTAVASREPLSGVGQTVPTLGGGRSQINAPPWALALAGVGILIALLAVLASVGWRLPARRKRDPWLFREIRFSKTARLLALMIPAVLGAVLVAAAIAGSHARTPIRPGKGKVMAPAKGTVPRAGSSYEPPTWILPSVIGVVLGGAGAVLLVATLRPRLGERADRVSRADEEELVADSLDEAVAASLDDLRNEPHPRRAVIAAYRRMEAALADAGLPRRVWEAPREYSGRAHINLELSARPLHQLTALFERARFGRGAVGEPLREQAIAALSQLGEELAEMTHQETLT